MFWLLDGIFGPKKEKKEVVFITGGLTDHNITRAVDALIEEKIIVYCGGIWSWGKPKKVFNKAIKENCHYQVLAESTDFPLEDNSDILSIANLVIKHRISIDDAKNMYDVIKRSTNKYVIEKIYLDGLREGVSQNELKLSDFIVDKLLDSKDWNFISKQARKNILARINETL